MEGRITVLSLFLIGNLVAAFMYFQWNIDKGAFLFVNRPSVPLVVLSFGPWIQAIILWMVIAFLRDVSAKDQLFVRLWLPILQSSRMAYAWEKFSACVVLGLPILGLAWAWHRFFTKGAVWHRATETLVERIHGVSPLLFFGRWDEFRYGNPTTMEAASFVPLWQPLLIMGCGCVLVLVLTFAIVSSILKRAPIRKRIATTHPPQ